MRPNIDIFLKKLVGGYPTGTHEKEKPISKQAGGEVFFFFWSLYTYLSVYFILKADFLTLFVSSQALRVAFLVASLTICVIGFTC